MLYYPQMPAHWRAWTPEEYGRAIRLRQAGISIRGIAQQLGRGRDSVAHKLARGKAIIASRRWTKPEVKRLQQLYPVVEAKTLLRAFPRRTTDAIQLKARKLGLRRPLPPPQFRIDPLLLRRIKALTPCKLAYIAGIIDGEGHISRGRGLGIHVGNTSEALIDWLFANIGAAKRQVKAKPDRKPFWQWTLTQSQAAALLLARIDPYLVIKKA